MVISFISSADGQHGNWIAIEFHGQLQRCSSYLERIDISNVYFKKNNQVIINVGNFILEGKEVTLDKPLAILKKECTLTDSGEKSCTNYEAHAIVKKKLIFRSRPKPVIVDVTKFQ